LKQIVVLFASIAIAFALSWLAVYGYWFAAYSFKSVAAVRTADSLAAVVLTPAEIAIASIVEAPGTSLLLTDPLRYATINALLSGLTAFLALRLTVFKDR
jgi:hypothetical protein